MKCRMRNVCALATAATARASPVIMTKTSTTVATMCESTLELGTSVRFALGETVKAIQGCGVVDPICPESLPQPLKVTQLPP